MKTTVSAIVIGLGLAIGSAQALAQDAKTVAKPASGLKDVTSKASYSIGLEYGQNLKPRMADLDLDLESFLKGFRDAIKGDKPELSEAEIEQCMIGFQKDLKKRREAKMVAQAPPEVKNKAGKNTQDGEKYLAANKAKAGVKVTESGLQYEVLKEGKGASPKATDKVKVHYRGTLINGKEFDSSIKKGMPVTFPVNRVIPGWTEALQLMKVGSKYKLAIPSELAYGFQGQGEDIGPNEVLVFEVELLGIE